MMKKSLKSLSLAVLTLIAVIATSCQSSNPEIEKAIAGTWTYSLTETEDGISVTATATESYSLRDHRFTTKIVFYLGYPINERFYSMTYSGKWKATKTEIYNEIDENSFEFSFNNSITDRSDRAEIRSEMLREMENQGYREMVEIKSPITDTFEAEDGDGQTYTYKRVN